MTSEVRRGRDVCLLEKVKVMSTVVDYCVVCGDDQVRHEKKQLDFDVRGQTMHVEVPVRVCSACGSTYQTDADPAELAFAEYRDQTGLLTPADIKSIRKRYSLSQRSFAALLGMSEATINRYEGGGLQDEAHDQAIRSCVTAEGMRELLQRRGDRLSDWQRRRVEEALDGAGKTNESTVGVSSPWCMPQEMSLRTGFREFDFYRYAAVAVWFCRHMKAVTATSLNKLLFYADFLHFQNESVSLTGAAYRRVPYGPVPAAYGELREHMEWEQIIAIQEVEYQNGNVGEEFRCGARSDTLDVQFSRCELATLEAIANKFKEWTPSRISDYSHHEAAWLDTEDRALISYDKARHLSLKADEANAKQVRRGSSDYDHHTKAGNQGDCVKHPALIAAVDVLIAAIGRRFRYADTFAAYAWNQLAKGGEWRQGIGRLADKPQLLANTHTKCWANYFLPRPEIGSRYPGSAKIVTDLCENRGVKVSLALWDIAEGPVQSLRSEFGSKEHTITQESALATEQRIRDADFVFIDPPDKSHWPAIRPFLTDPPENQAILVWLPVTANTNTTPPREDKTSERCRKESLALPRFQVSKVRWALGGRVIGCQLIYRLPPVATDALRSAVDCVVRAADWQDDGGLLGVVHYDPS